MGAIVRKAKRSLESNDLKLLHTLTQPTRRKVLEVLLETESLYIKKIAEIIEETERNTSFHLAWLAEEGYVEGEFRQISSSNTRAGKYYKLNPENKSKIKKIVELTI